jgi:hypothetical protein
MKIFKIHIQNVLLLLSLFLFCNKTEATVSQYAFAQSAGTYTPITSAGTVLFIALLQEDLMTMYLLYNLSLSILYTMECLTIH